ncbi:MAG TPA: hypothetical protein VN428_09885, partial [Bryobacteraceae bacterium]|nr:hypothetical protein [Bryobacteraceae bacterium]
RPSCSIPLAPGSTMVVVYRMRLPHAVVQVLGNAGTVHLRASLVETKLKDTSYFVESSTPSAQSDVVQLHDR